MLTCPRHTMQFSLRNAATIALMTSPPINYSIGKICLIESTRFQHLQTTYLEIVLHGVIDWWVRKNIELEMLRLCESVANTFSLKGLKHREFVLVFLTYDPRFSHSLLKADLVSRLGPYIKGQTKSMNAMFCAFLPPYPYCSMKNEISYWKHEFTVVSY